MASKAPPPPAPEPGAARRGPVGRIVFTALLATLALRLGAWFIASNWLWGVDTFHHWPAGGAALLAALATLGFVPAVGRRIERALERVGTRWERAGLAGDLAVSAAVTVLLFLLRDPVRFTGDFDLRVGLLGLANVPPALLERIYPLDMVVNIHFARLLWRSGMTAATALQATGALMGGLFALVGFRLLRSAGARGGTFLAGALALLTGGSLVHFAGYDKFGPLLLGIALAAWGAVEVARTGRGAWTLAAGVSAAVLSHRSGYLLVPAAAWIIAFGLRRARAGERGHMWAAAAAMAAVVIAMFPRTLDTLMSFDRVTHLPGGSVTRARVAGEAPAVMIRLSDCLNALSFVAPLWIAGLAATVALGGSKAPAARPAAGRAARFSLALPAALALGAFTALQFAVEPGGGWARDWDVAVGTGTLAALATSYALVTAWREPDAEHARAPAVTLALAVSVALWGIHTSETIGLKRAETLVTARPALSEATRTGFHDFWGVRALNRGRADEAASQFERAIAVGGPNPRLVHQAGIAYLRAGRLAAARSSFERAAALNRGVADPWAGLAQVALAERDTVAALAALDSALARNPAHAENRRLARALRTAWEARAR